MLILNTNSDLNLYKETWQAEKPSGCSTGRTCCAVDEPNTTGEQNKLPDIDFNHWTGELTNQKKVTCGTKLTTAGSLFQGSFKIFAVKPDAHV